MKLIDITGQKFNRLTAIKRIDLKNVKEVWFKFHKLFSDFFGKTFKASYVFL